MTKLMEKHEVAELLRVSERTIDRLRKSGDLPAIRIRERVLFKPEDVTAFINGHRARR